MLDVPITYPEATLGATVQIPTPDGPVALKVPSGSEHGKLLRVKGRGAPKLNGGGKGDLLARLVVTVPKKLSKAEREALEAYQRVAREDPRDHLAEERVMPQRGRYMISVAAELAGLHPQTLRMYEARGLVRPARTPGGTRLYSENDVDRLRLIQRLTTEVGLNLAGVEHVLRLEDELRRMRARMSQLERELRDEIQLTHKQYRRDVVLYQQREATGDEELIHGLQQAHDQERRGCGWGAGARAASRQPRADTRPPDDRAAGPGASEDTRPARRARAPRSSAARPRHDWASSPPSPAAAPSPRPARRSAACSTRR